MGPLAFAAVDFDGVDDYVEVADHTSLQISSNFTIAFWFKSNSTTQSQKYLIAKNNDAGTNQWAVIYEYVNDAIEFFAAGTGFSGTDPRTNSQLTISDTNWHHVVYAYDGSTWRGYVDASETFNVSRSFSLGALSGLNVFFGAANAVPQAIVNGLIDEVRIYNRALSVNEIETLAKSRLKYVGISSSGLVGYWPMDDCSEGTSGDAVTFVDRSGSGNNGTGVDGANNTGLTCKGSPYLSYP